MEEENLGDHMTTVVDDGLKAALELLKTLDLTSREKIWCVGVLDDVYQMVTQKYQETQFMDCAVIPSAIAAALAFAQVIEQGVNEL